MMLERYRRRFPYAYAAGLHWAFPLAALLHATAALTGWLVPLSVEALPQPEVAAAFWIIAGFGAALYWMERQWNTRARLPRGTRPGFLWTPLFALLVTASLATPPVTLTAVFVPRIRATVESSPRTCAALRDAIIESGRPEERKRRSIASMLRPRLLLSDSLGFIAALNNWTPKSAREFGGVPCLEVACVLSQFGSPAAAAHIEQACKNNGDVEGLKEAVVQVKPQLDKAFENAYVASLVISPTSRLPTFQNPQWLWLLALAVISAALAAALGLVVRRGVMTRALAGLLIFTPVVTQAFPARVIGSEHLIALVTVVSLPAAALTASYVRRRRIDSLAEGSLVVVALFGILLTGFFALKRALSIDVLSTATLIALGWVFLTSILFVGWGHRFAALPREDGVLVLRSRQAGRGLRRDVARRSPRFAVLGGGLIFIAPVVAGGIGLWGAMCRILPSDVPDVLALARIVLVVAATYAAVWAASQFRIRSALPRGVTLGPLLGPLAALAVIGPPLVAGPFLAQTLARRAHEMMVPIDLDSRTIPEDALTNRLLSAASGWETLAASIGLDQSSSEPFSERCLLDFPHPRSFQLIGGPTAAQVADWTRACTAKDRAALSAFVGRYQQFFENARRWGSITSLSRDDATFDLALLAHATTAVCIAVAWGGIVSGATCMTTLALIVFLCALNISLRAASLKAAVLLGVDIALVSACLIGALGVLRRRRSRTADACLLGLSLSGPALGIGFYDHGSASEALDRLAISMCWMVGLAALHAWKSDWYRGLPTED
jgi:hypothetical protein